jgi:hypothetical protein
MTRGRSDNITETTAAVELPAETTSAPGELESTSGGLETFDHMVVLMIENRSFDHMLGYLYEPGEVPRGQTFEGVAGKNLSNPIPADALDAEREVVLVQKGYVVDNPNPDPGEEFPHVNTQLFCTVAPEKNRYKYALAISSRARYRPRRRAGMISDTIDCATGNSMPMPNARSARAAPSAVTLCAKPHAIPPTPQKIMLAWNTSFRP